MPSAFHLIVSFHLQLNSCTIGVIPCIGAVAIRNTTLFDVKKSINDDTIFVLAHVA